MWKFTELQKSSETMHGKNALDFLKFSEAPASFHMNIRMNEFSTIIFHSAEEQNISRRSDLRSEVSFPLFRLSQKKKNTQCDLQRDSKVMRKHKNFASLVETKNQHVLPSNTEKNSREEKTKLIFFSQHFESLRFCFSFWRFEAQFHFFCFWRSGPHSALSFQISAWGSVVASKIWFLSSSREIFLGFQTNFGFCKGSSTDNVTRKKLARQLQLAAFVKF
jgi:hypothetical protein